MNEYRVSMTVNNARTLESARVVLTFAAHSPEDVRRALRLRTVYLSKDGRANLTGGWGHGNGAMIGNEWHVESIRKRGASARPAVDPATGFIAGEVVA